MIGVAGCATTHQVRSLQAPSGFLGDYSELKAGTGGQAKLLYVRPGVDWKIYDKVLLEPVQLWHADEPDSPLGSLRPQDQQILVDALYNSLRAMLSVHYEGAKQPGPGVLRIRAAVTEARPSKPVLNLASSVTPIGFGVSAAKRIAFGTHTSVGLIQVEAELLDAQTGQRLAAAVDRRAGTKAWATKFGDQWADIRESFDYWATQLSKRLAEWRKQSKPATP
jgi:hypothetical protein